MRTRCWSCSIVPQQQGVQEQCGPVGCTDVVERDIPGSDRSAGPQRCGRFAGERARKRSVETRNELTAQEARIARLARDGLSNPEIRGWGVLQPRTVGYHPRKVFAKFNVSSRLQPQAALLERPQRTWSDDQTDVSRPSSSLAPVCDYADSRRLLLCSLNRNRRMLPS
jgi:DNA-binding CsgD family transcriptional regulator